jgi:hypothetical protein
MLAQESKERAHTVMVRLPPKKGSRMTTVASQRTGKNQDAGRDELETQISDLARKTYAAIEAARSKMSEEERDEADRKARIILERSSAVSSDQRHSA